MDLVVMTKYFNPLPRKEGDGLSLQKLSVWRGYFNPLPRKEGDDRNNEVNDDNEISIHSLVKRETVVSSKVRT